MASFEDHQGLRGVKRSLDEDDMDFPDLDALDPRNHSPVAASTATDGGEDNINRASGEQSTDPRPSKFQKTNDEKAVPSSSNAPGLEHFTERLNKPSTSETGTSGTSSQPQASGSGSTSSNDDGLQLPTTTASVLTQLDKSMSSGGDSESDADEKKMIDIETCSNASSPTKSPKKHSDQKDKDKKSSEEKNDEEDAVASLKTKREKQEEERLKMQVLVSHFSEDQLNRYEMFRRAAFPKAAIKRLMQNITGTTVSHNVVIAMSGIAKVFVGEAVETALDVTEKLGETGPLQPKHFREAGSILKRRNSIPNTKYTKKLFR